MYANQTIPRDCDGAMVEQAVLRRNDKENPQDQNENFPRKRITNLSGII
jgi:hypothetical protein